MINKIFDRSKYIFTVALLVLLSFHLHAALLSEPLHSIPNTALHTLEQWPSGIFRIEVLIGGNSGSNAYEKRPHFSFKIIEVLRPSRDTLGDLNIPIEATWVRSCIESNCQDSEKFLSPTPGTRALISIWGGGAPLLVSDHFWADNPENYQVAKRLIVFRPLTDYLLEYTFFLALILPFIALLIGYFNLHLAAGISLISLLLAYIHDINVPTSSNIRIDLLLIIPASVVALLIIVVAVGLILRRRRRNK